LHEPLPTPFLHDQLEMQKSQQSSFEAAMRVVMDAEMEQEAAEFEAATEFIRITDDH
jgi:hypothetical protein